MAAPLKPWERNTAVNQRQPSFHPEQANSFITTSPHGTQIGGGGGVSSTSNYPPPLPPRPTNYGANNSSYLSYRSPNTYGGFGNFGGFGRSPYFGSYGGLGSYGGYNSYVMPPEPDETGFIQAAEDSSRQAFQTIESIVHAFGSLSMMLESTYHAVHSSFRAVLGVADHFSRMKSHFAQIFSAFAVVRTLRWLYKKLLFLIGLRNQDPSLEAAWHAGGNTTPLLSGPITEADLKASRSSWPIFMFLAVVFGGPYLIWRLLRSLAPNISSKSSDWKKGEGEHYAAVGVYTFQGANTRELSFQGGESLVLAPKNQQPNVRGWLLASNKKNSGLVPVNYIKILGLRQTSSGTSNNSLRQGTAFVRDSVSTNTNNLVTRSSNPPPLRHSVQPKTPAHLNESQPDKISEMCDPSQASVQYKSEDLMHDYASVTTNQDVVLEEKEKVVFPDSENVQNIQSENIKSEADGQELVNTSATESNEISVMKSDNCEGKLPPVQDKSS